MRRSVDTGDLFGREPQVVSVKAASGGTLAGATVNGALGQPAQVTLAGRVQRVLYEPPADAMGDSIVVVVTDDGTVVKLVGPVMAPLRRGARVRADAVPTWHPKYGAQFSAVLIDEMRPSDVDGIRDYLARTIDGIGPSTAAQVVAQFGQHTFEVLDQNIDRLREVAGIGEQRVARIKESWAGSSRLRRLWQTLAPFELPRAVPEQLVRAFGDEALRVVTQRPYELLRLPGIGFKRADLIARAFGIAADAPFRGEAAVLHVVREAIAQEGHTVVPIDWVVERAARLAALGRDQVRSSVERQMATGKVVSRRTQKGEGLSVPRCVAHENAIAQNIQRILGAAPGRPVAAAQVRRLASPLGDPDQIAAVELAFRSTACVVTGRPGCGKTTTIRAIVQVATENGMAVVLAAPTGKAARRITEATGCEATTMHRALRLRPGGAPEYSSANPIDADLFVVDESSLLDVHLAAMWLDAIPQGARVVLVGDPDQLASVGPGNVLADLVRSTVVPVAELRTVHRAALQSAIVRVAHEVIAGKVSARLLAGTHEVRFARIQADADIVATTVARYQDLVQAFGQANVQVLCARRATALGTHALNAALREAANPPAADKTEVDAGHGRLRVGDRVIRTQSDRDLGVDNGEVGTIVAIQTAGAPCVTVRFGERLVEHTRADLSDLELAYCITAHKAQGSEYQGVIVVLPRAHLFMLNRALLYTAITRGKAAVCVVGAEEVVRASVARPAVARMTGLVDDLRRASPRNQRLGCDGPSVPSWPARAAMRPTPSGGG